jgi:hypothetical protein
MAAALCRREGLGPRDLSTPDRIKTLQTRLIASGQHIPGIVLHDSQDLAIRAMVSASSTLQLGSFSPDGPLQRLDHSWAMLLPVVPQPMPKVTFQVDVAHPTTLRMELRTSSRPANYTPDVTLASKTFNLAAGGNQTISAALDATIDQYRYAFVCLMANPDVSVWCSEQRVTGVLSVSNKFNRAVATSSRQTPPGDIGVDSFEFWMPERRPGGRNLAMTISPALNVFRPENVINGVARPTVGPNAWVADPHDPAPTLILRWDQPQTIGRIELTFDADWDHPAESVLMGHPESVMPFCVRRYRILEASGRLLHECNDNHQTRNTIRLNSPVTTSALKIVLEHPSECIPAALFEVRCYSE